MCTIDNRNPCHLIGMFTGNAVHHITPQRKAHQIDARGVNGHIGVESFHKILEEVGIGCQACWDFTVREPSQRFATSLRKDKQKTCFLSFGVESSLAQMIDRTGTIVMETQHYWGRYSRIITFWYIEQ